MAKKAQATFEDSLSRLEDIVKQMESGKLTLDESMTLYEEGIKLAAACKGRLNLARNKVMMLVDDKDGMKEVELDEPDA